MIKPEMSLKKPRKKKVQDDEDEVFESVVDVFEHESELK